MATPITIGNFEFRTKGAAQDKCREILYGYAAGAPVSKPEDHDFLEALLIRHPHSEEKFGVGILRFEIRQNPMFPNQRSIYLVRTDGSDSDFSFLKCITLPTIRHRVLGTARRVIAPQVVAVMNAAFATSQPVLCALTGEPLLLPTNAHVDHGQPTFLRLITEFAATCGGWDRIPLHRGDGLIGEEMADLAQREAWVTYHAERANLRVVSINANLSILRTGQNRETW